MLQPKPKLNLDLSGYKKEEEVSPKLNLDLSGYRPEKKKESSVSTSTTAPSNAVLDGGTNSLATSTNIGFPEIDTNSVAPGMGEQPKIGDKTVKVKDEMGFGGASINRLDTSLASFSKSIYDAPKMLLDAIYSPQNYIAEKLNIPSLKVDPEVYAYENIPSKQMDKVMANNNAKIAKYKADIGGDVLTAFENGDYVNTFKHAALNSFESAPLIVATILTGGSSAVANSIMIGSSASTQYDTLNKENPEMGTPEKLGNAAVNGTLEVIVGKYMEGVGGNVWRSLLKNKGAKEGASIATNSFKKSLEKVVGKSPAVGVAFEYAEERITNGLQQLNDIATGVKTEFDWNENKSSGLSSLGFSLPNSTALYSSKAFISNKSRQKVKSSNKEIMNLQSELQNDNITPENKKLITASIDKIYNENRNLLGAELEKLSSIQEVHKKELVSIDKAMDDSKSQAIDIKHDNNISNESKASLLKTLGDEFKKNIQRKNEILTKTPFELLSGNEQAKRKTKAAREIMKKENPDGTKSITIDDAESKKLATEIFDKELADKKIAENQQEAQPKAEEQKASEADKVEQLRANEQVELKELLPNAELKADGKIDVKKLSEEDAVVYDKVYDKYDKLITPLLEQSASPEVVAENVEGQGVSEEVVDNEKPLSSQKEAKKMESKVITVYHGGNLDGKGNFEEGNFYAAKDKNQAEEYAKGNGGKLYEYDIDESKLATEEEAREVLASLNIEAKGEETDNLMLHEVLDDRFDTSIDKEDFDKLRKELEKRGYQGISFTDEDITQRNKMGSENVVVFDPKSLQKKSGSNLKEKKSSVNKTNITKESEQKNIISLGTELLDAVRNADFKLRADGKGSKEVARINLETLTIEEENTLYSENKEYKELYDKSEESNLTEKEYERMSEIYVAERTKKQVKLLGELYQREKEKGDSSVFVDAVDKLLQENAQKQINNESTPETNTPTNGDVQPGVQPVGESGITKPETPAKEGIPSPVDGGKSKGDVEVVNENTTFKTKEETIKDDKGNPITFYHGSNNEFTDFNESMLGSFTGAESAKEGFFFTSNEGVANSYRQQSIYDSPNIEGLKKALNGLSKKEIAKLGTKLLPNRDEKFYYGDLTKQESIDDIVEDVIRDTEKDSYYPDRNKYIEKVSKIFEEKGIDLKPYLDKGQIVETNLDIKNPKIVDAKEEFAEDIELTKIIKDAKEQGHDGVIIKNTYDSISFDEKGNDTQLSDIVVVFDKSQINIKNKPTETPQTKLVEGDAEVSDLDNAKDQIAKGVLQWNGDAGAERVNLGITWADIRKGEADINRGKENTVPAKRLIEALKTAKEKGGYEYIQGKGGITNTQFVSLEDIQKVNNEYQLTDAEQKQVRENEFESARKYDEDFNSLSKNEQIEILENYENREDNSGTPVADSGQPQSKNDVPKAKEGKGAKPKPTTKERVAERVKLSDSKIDANSEAVKARLKAFTAMFPSADINPADYKTNGFTMDAVIDMVAKAAKSIAKGGIVTSEHINEAIKGWNMHFDDVVDAEAVAKYINPKKEEKEFEKEQGKRSLLKRLRDGGNPDYVNKIIDKIGLNYDRRTQSQVYADGVNFVKEVGVAEAYNAIKNGDLKDSDTVNVVYATILQEFPKMAENEIAGITDPIELSNLVKELDEMHEKIYEEFASRTTDAGQGISILNYIINQDLKIKYSLSQQIKAFKKINNGVVPAAEMSKMKELDQQYKEAVKRIEELEAKLQEAQEQSDFDNIVDEEKREPKISKTKREKAEKIIKALDDFEKSILKNSYSDATLITPILIQGVRAAKLAIKANVEISEAIEKAIDLIKKELDKLGKTFEDEERFRAGLNKSLESSGVDVKQPKVTVDKNGKLKIPIGIIKDFIAKGGTDLSEFAKQVQESIKNEFPDVTVREIRESVSNYGKNKNQNKNQILDEIRALKAEDRLRIEYEDLTNNIAKQKKEVRKIKLSQTAIRLKKQIKQLQDNLGITETDRTNRSVNYTKKRIEILREKIKNKDFAKKVIKPIEQNQELKDALIEKNRIQEEFDYIKHEYELENRTTAEKVSDFMSDMYDSQRVTLATGEFSFVGAQGGFYMVDATFSRKTMRNLISNFKSTSIEDWKKNPFKTIVKIAKSAHSAESIMKLINVLGTANNYLDFQRIMKEDPNYDTYIKSGLRILGEDVKSQVRDENFYGNNILTLLKVPVLAIDLIKKKETLSNFKSGKLKIETANQGKKRTTLQGLYEKLKTGKVSDKNKKTATEMFSNANPLSMFERGNTVFMNMARKQMFDKYADALYLSGKNPVDHIDDFKKLASAVNTITGSGNMNQTVTMALPVLNKLMFSARYFSATWNLTPPFSLYYLYKLGDAEITDPKSWKNIKPTAAQKAFVKPMLKGFVTFYAASALLKSMINLGIDDDDEMSEEEKAKKRAYIEHDPRSSDFMQVVSGDTRTDLFGPYRNNIVLLSKLSTGQTKKNDKIIENGADFGSRRDFDIGTEYLAGKLNPFPGMFSRYAMGKKTEVVNEDTGLAENRRMLYDDRVDIGYQIKHNMMPIFATTVKDVLAEDPILGPEFYITMALFGKQTSVYGSKGSGTFEEETLLEQEARSLKNVSEEKRLQNSRENSLQYTDRQVKERDKMILLQKMKLPYYNPSGRLIDISKIDFSKNDADVEKTKNAIKAKKLEFGLEE
jgi:hypothetical protein